MMEWFQQKRGVYITEIRAKTIFCNIKSDKFCETLDACNVFFRHDDYLNFTFPKRVFHVPLESGYLLQTLKINQTLRKHKIKSLYICPKDSIDIQKHMIEAFGLPQHTVLTIIQSNLADKLIIKEIRFKLTEILKKFKYKKIIFVCETNNKLFHEIKTYGDTFEIVEGSVEFEDLSNDTQKTLLKKKNISFQGDDVCLEEILEVQENEDYGKAFDSNILEALVIDQTINMGSKVRFLNDDIACCYVNRVFKRPIINSDDEEMREEFFSEENIYDVNEKVILIADSAGMGKTTVLNKLSWDVKVKYPHLWVIKIELNDYTEFLKNLLINNIKTVNIMELLHSKDNKCSTNLENFVYSMHRKVVLMLDGVDEVSPDYSELILSFLSECQKTNNFEKIFVTTRPHIAEELKVRLQVEPFSLQSFMKENQVKFLMNYWSHNLDLDDVSNYKCEKYAEALLRKVHSWIDTNRKTDGDFAAIPQQIVMLAEIFQENNSTLKELTDWEGCKAYLEIDKAKPKLPEKVNITKLFLKKKRDIFLFKENLSGNTVANQALINEYEECLDYHRTLALQLILDKEQCNLFSSYQEFDKDKKTNILKIEIVQKIDSDFLFIHRTFAEFFVAECLIRDLQLENLDVNFQEFLIDKIFSDDKFGVVRVFFNSFLQLTVDFLPATAFKSYEFLEYNINLETSSNLIHSLAREGCVAILQLVFKCIDFKIIKDKECNIKDLYTNINSLQNRNTLNILKYLTERGGINIIDEQGRTPLHYAVFNNNIVAAKFLVEQGINIGAEDKYGCIALYEAITSDQVDIVTCFIENILSTEGAKVKEPLISYASAYLGRREIIEPLLTQQKVDANSRTVNGETLIFGAIRGGQFSMVEYLVQQDADINLMNVDGYTALHLATLKGYRDISTFLLECGADVNAKDNDGCTALHIAASWGLQSIVELLVEREANVSIRDSDGCTALYLAAEKGNLNILKFLNECGADISVTDNSGRSALDLAVIKGDLEIVKFLIAVGRDISFQDKESYKYLFLSFLWNKLSIVEFFVNLGVDVNITNSSGSTMLHLAAEKGALEPINWLIERGADINITDNNSRTPLHLAILYNHQHVIEHLVKMGANVNIKDCTGATPLHLVIENSNWSAAKLIIKYEADIDVTDNNNRTALHLFALRDRWDMVELLVKLGAELNIKDNFNNTVLLIAIERDYIEIVSLLVEYGADINFKNADGTALHLFVLRQQRHMMKLFLSLGVDVNIKNIYGVTAVHLAIRKNQLDTAKLLIEHGAYIDLTDSDTSKALLECALNDEWEMVEFLVELGVDINDIYHDDYTLLQLAVLRGYLNTAEVLVKHVVNDAHNNNYTVLHLFALREQWSMVKSFVELGSNINLRDEDGYTVLHLAAKKDNLDVVKWLSTHGADINITDNDSCTPLHLCVLENIWNTTDFLIGCGADASIKDSNGNTVLQSAIKRNRLDVVVKLLVKYDADINSTDNNSRTALHVAAFRGHRYLVEFLLEKGANINAADNNGYTALYLATLSSQWDVVRLLVSHGANVNIVNNFSSTGLHLAIQKGHFETVKLLVEHGADINLVNNCKRTVLHLAIICKSWHSVQFLLKRGANVNITNSYGSNALHLAAENDGLDTVKTLVRVGLNVISTDSSGRTALHYAKDSRVVKFLVKKGADISIEDIRGHTAASLSKINNHTKLLKYLEPENKTKLTRFLLWVPHKS